MTADGADRPVTSTGGAARNLFGRGSIYTLATAAPILTGFLVTPLLTRALGILAYDQVSVALVVMNFTIGLLALGLPVAITRHAIVEAEGEPGARGIVLTGASVVLICGVAAALVVVATGGQPSTALGIAVGGIGAGVAMTQAYSLARSDSWFYVALAVGTSLCAPAVGLAAVFFVSRDATTYYWAMLIIYSIVALGGYARLLIQGPISFSRKGLARALRVGLPVVPHQIAVGSATGVAVVIAQLQLAPGSSAQTQLSLLVASAPLIIISALSYAWTPIVLRGPVEEQGARLEATAGRVAWLAALGAGGLAMLSPWALALLAPADSYGLAEMVPVVGVACAAAPFAAGFLAYSQLVIARGATGPLAILSPLALAIGAGATLVLSHQFGLPAMGASFLVTYVGLLVFTRLVARRASTVRWKERALVLPITAGIAACGLASALPVAESWSITVRLVLAAVLLLLASGVFLRTVRGPKAA